jgi:hypothetical protein
VQRSDLLGEDSLLNQTQPGGVAEEKKNRCGGGWQRRIIWPVAE